MPRQYSRKEFYDLVWSKPITHIAKDFGLSDVAIHKICKKHDIPNPPLGYWAKKAHGKAVTQTPLLRGAKDDTDTVIIAEGSFLSEPDSLRSVREEARINASAFEAHPPAPRHPIVERTISALLKAKVDERGLVSSAQQGCVSVTVAPSSIERVGAALDLLVVAAAAQNFELIKFDKAIVFTGHETTIGFSVQETVKRVKHELTAEELAEEERHKKKLRKDGWFSSFLFRSRFPEWDYLPTGQLAVEVEGTYSHSGSAPRRNFRDGKTQKIETMAVEIAIGMAVTAAAKKELIRANREREEKWEEERRLRQEAERQKHISGRRRDELTSVLEDLEKSIRLQGLVQSLRAGVAGNDHPRVGEFIKWAEACVDRLSDGLSADGLEDRFLRNKVFGSDDDHNFYPGRW
jgi:hypothetical protein